LRRSMICVAKRRWFSLLHQPANGHFARPLLCQKITKKGTFPSIRWRENSLRKFKASYNKFLLCHDEPMESGVGVVTGDNRLLGNNNKNNGQELRHVSPKPAQPYLLFRFNILVNSNHRASGTIFQSANGLFDELQGRHGRLLLREEGRRRFFSCGLERTSKSELPGWRARPNRGVSRNVRSTS
jgi:hypothetical protein